MQEEWNSEDGAGRLVGGAITWEVEGGRREVQLEVAELMRGGRLERVGLWAPRAGLSWQRHDPPADTPPPESMTNRTFTVLIALVRAPVACQPRRLTSPAGPASHEPRRPGSPADPPAPPAR